MIEARTNDELAFARKAPNASTRKALKELEAGKGKRFHSIGELMTDLNADD